MQVVPERRLRTRGWNERALAFHDVPESDPAARPGLSISAAPATKSATTASIAMPPPAMRMPVCPVARNCASMLRRCNSRVMASAVYFFPNAQSVPTVRRRWPLRLRPVAVGMSQPGACEHRSAGVYIFGCDAQRLNVAQGPVHPTPTRSSPASRAATRGGIQESRTDPPMLATPMTTARAPRRHASRGERTGRPIVVWRRRGRIPRGTPPVPSPATRGLFWRRHCHLLHRERSDRAGEDPVPTHPVLGR